VAVFFLQCRVCSLVDIVPLFIMVEAVSTSETSVSICRTTKRNIAARNLIILPFSAVPVCHVAPPFVRTFSYPCACDYATAHRGRSHCCCQIQASAASVLGEGSASIRWINGCLGRCGLNSEEKNVNTRTRIPTARFFPH
jgi:hypothetical protein